MGSIDLTCHTFRRWCGPSQLCTSQWDVRNNNSVYGFPLEPQRCTYIQHLLIVDISQPLQTINITSVIEGSRLVVAGRILMMVHQSGTEPPPVKT